MDIIKNPIILGILAGVLTYLILEWNNNKKDPQKQKQKQKSNILIPAIVAVVVWMVTHYYFTYSNSSSDKKIEGANNESPKIKLIDSNPLKNTKIPEIFENFTHSFDKGYNLKSKNTLQLPQTDVFIDLAKF